jgi:hypothetical protein
MAKSEYNTVERIGIDLLKQVENGHVGNERLQLVNPTAQEQRLILRGFLIGLKAASRLK